MSVFHAPAHCASHSERGEQALARLVEQVNALRARPVTGEDFEAVERELRALFAEAEREVVGETLERLDVDLPFVEMEGRRYHRVLRSHATYTSAAGAVGVHRTLYRCGRERAVVPMEWRAGIVAGHWTGLAARQASVVVAHVTPQEGEAVFREWGRVRPSKSSLDRLAKELGARWEGQREAFEAALRKGCAVAEEAVTVAVSLDGVMVPMKDAKRADGSSGYQEAGCGTLTTCDAEGERLETVYVGRMPQPCKEALKKTLCAELEAVLAKRPDLQVVKIADGAHDNWRYLDTLAPQGTSVVDFYHAAEQLKSGLDACYGQDDAKGRAHYEKLRHLLRHECGGVEKVIRSLNHQRRKQPENKRIAEVLGYFRNHRHRMGYAEAKARHLPIGSGVVEAACKTLVTQRLKRSGMRWRHAGGQAILTLRALIQSRRFDSAWEMLSGTYRREVTIPDNVVPFPCKRAA